VGIIVGVTVGMCVGATVGLVVGAAVGHSPHVPGHVCATIGISQPRNAFAPPIFGRKT